MSDYGIQVANDCAAHESALLEAGETRDEAIYARTSEIRRLLAKGDAETFNLIREFLDAGDDVRCREFYDLIADAAQVWGEESRAENIGNRFRSLIADCIGEIAEWEQT